jgi:hypothetical protein
MKVFLLSVFFGLCHTLAQCQDCSKLYEQTAFDFFMDSILTSEYPVVNEVYYDKHIANGLSLLRHPIAFEEYTKSIDSFQAIEIKKKVSAAQAVDLSMCRLQPKEGYMGKLKEIVPGVWKRKEWKKIMAVYVKKRVVSHPGLTIVELVARHDYHRYHYFFEINEEKNNVIRWYKTTIEI